MKPGPYRSLGVALAAILSLAPGGALAQVPEGEITDLPVLSAVTPRGSGSVAPVEGPSAVAKTVDGNLGDWVGSASRYGGTAVVSAGEYVYQDHIFDARGADDGRDASRLEKTDALEEALPQSYRIDALAQADPAGEFGVPVPEDYSYDDTYGDATSHQDAADLAELRLATSGDSLALLARTTTMASNDATALLVLADTAGGSPEFEVPFNSGLTTSVADVAFFISNGRVLRADLATGEVGAVAGGLAAANSAGWANALEASLPLGAVTGEGGTLSLAVASGRPSGSGDGFAPIDLETANDQPHANVANVAFRFDEPVRIWFERQQALALHDGSIDSFFTAIDTAELRSGASQAFVPGPGYHDRIFISDPATGVPREGGRDGVFQHYGVYLPQSYDGTPVPLQWWLHWRGGNAHTGASVVPKIFKQYGEDRDSIVVSPSGRGTSTWYVGRGHVDFRQVWSDAFETFAIDRDRVYTTGHSMGGWGSYLLTLLYPDRFAAAAPVAGPVTQGMWTGVDFEGCDEFSFDEYSPCYISANESRPRDQHTRKLLENARHVPYAILHGTDDELVAYSGVFRQSERLIELGYRHRLYTYPGYEHYTHPIMDQWAEAASYLHSFTRPENPAQVTYKRDMPFERATEEVQSGGATLNFDFDSAYWMSGLKPADMQTGVASFDGRSLAISEDPYVAVPDTGAPTAPGQSGPYIITGLQWLTDPTATAGESFNGFDITLDGSEAVTLDVARMAIDESEQIDGIVETELPLDLGLAGEWAAVPDVLVDDQPVPATLVDGVVRFVVPAAGHTVTVIPGEPEPQQRPTSLSLQRSGKGSTVTLSATLVDAGTSAGLGDKAITFFADGAAVGSARTNQAGVASVTFKRGAKNEAYSATFAGDDNYGASSA